MKRLYSFLLLLAAMCAFNPSAGATTGPEAVDIFCQAFRNMTAQVNRCTDINQIENLDFDKAIATAGVENITDDCTSYVLTSTDRRKLSDSFNGFVDAMVNKMYNLVGGAVDKSFISSQFEPMKASYKKSLDNSKTFGEFVEAIDTIF